MTLNFSFDKAADERADRYTGGGQSAEVNRTQVKPLPGVSPATQLSSHSSDKLCLLHQTIQSEREEKEEGKSVWPGGKVIGERRRREWNEGVDEQRCHNKVTSTGVR